MRHCILFSFVLLVGSWGQTAVEPSPFEVLPEEPAPAEAAASEAEGEGASTEKKLEDLPLRLTAVADEAQHRWDPLNTGILAKGTGCFDGAMGLSAGDKAFEVAEVWEDPTNGTYRMRGTLAGLKVERRILIERKLGAARYLDIVHNSSDEDRSLTLTYQIALSFSAANVYTSRGKPLAGRLGSRDFGLAVEAPADAGHPGVLLVLAHERSKHKPQVSVAADRQALTFDHRVELKAGQKIAILNWIGQADFQGADSLGELFANIYSKSKLVAPPVGDEFLELLVNFPTGDGEDGGAGYLVAVEQLTDRLQVGREADIDKLRVENGSVLSGEALGGDLVIASRFGDIAVPRASVAVLQGGAGRGREQRVFLRDGTVYTGEVTVGGLGLKGGFEVSLEMAQLDSLLYRLGDNDGEFPAGTHAFVKLHTGEILPVAGAGDVALGFVSAWGPLEVPVAAIGWLRYVKDPSPRYRVSLLDGTQLTVFLDPVELRVVVAGALGEVSFGAAEVAALWGAEVELPKGFDEAQEVAELDEIPKDFAAGACLLSGSNLIAGAIGQAELHVLTGSTVTTVKTADIVRLSRSGDGAELAPVFTVELAGGDELTGMLQERVLDVQSSGLSWKVPVQHLIATRRPGAVDSEDEIEVTEEEGVEPETTSAARSLILQGGSAQSTGQQVIGTNPPVPSPPSAVPSP